MNIKNSIKKYIVPIVLSILLILAATHKGIIAYSTSEEVTFTVTDKERVTNSNDSSTYLIFTDKGTFKNIDTIWYWKWNSSDLYGNIEKGKTYKAKVYGFRFGLLSWYENIVEVTEL